MRVDVPIRVTDSNIRHDNNTNSNMPKLNNGDSVIAQVVSKNGDIITLQRPDGTRMVANVMSDVILSLGDEINMTVLGQSGRQVMMQLNTVAAGTVETENSNLQIEPFVNLETQVSHIFKNMGLKPGTQVMNNVMNVLQQNQGLSPRAAIFMVLNNIEPTAQNIETVNNMLDSNIGAKLTQIANQIISQNENIDSGLKLVDASAANANTATGAKNSNVANTNVPNEQSAQTNATNNVTAQVVNVSLVSESSQTIDGTNNNQNVGQPENVGQQPNQVANNSNDQVNVDNNNQGNSNQTAGKEAQATNSINIAEQGKDTAQQQKVQQNTGNVVNNLSETMDVTKQSSDEAKILTKVLSLFNKIYAEKNDGNKIFDSKEEMQSKLSELKEMVKSSDIKNKDAILSKAESALMEKSIESDINRFTYVQIPISNQQNTQTAEVFVYRRKSKKNDADSENFSILLGLDTMNLGRIETLVKFEKNNVSLKMSNENKKASSLIKKHASSLGEELKSLGFNLVGIRVEDLYEKTTIVNAEETLMRLDTNVERRVDYRV